MKTQTQTIETLIENFIQSTKNVVEISIAKYIDEININPSEGLNKALDYVLELFILRSPLPKDVLIICIKTALAVSLEEQGYVDSKFNQSIINSLK